MGNSLSSKKKNKQLNFKKIKNNLNTRNSVSNSATGRHSIGLINKTSNLKESKDKNDIFTQIKNRNKLRESLRKSIRNKNIFDEDEDPKNFNKSYDNNYFYFDYKKIFLEVFPSLNKTKIVDQIDYIENQDDNHVNYNKGNTHIDYELEESIKENCFNKNNLNKKHFEINEINCNKKLDFTDELNEINSKFTENEYKSTKEKVCEENNIKVKSFITALSKENTEDFLVSQKNIESEEDVKQGLKLDHEAKINKNIEKKKNNKKHLRLNLCNDTRCLYFSNTENSKNLDFNKNNNLIQNNLEAYEDNDDMKEDKSNKLSDCKHITKQNSLNLGLEELEDFETSNKINHFSFDNKENNVSANGIVNESTINFISNLGTPCKKLNKSNDLEFSETKKDKYDLNLNSLMKLINKDSYFDSPNAINNNYNESCDSQKILEKKVEKFNYENNPIAERLNKSTVSSSKEYSKEFICEDCLFRLSEDKKDDTLQDNIQELEIKIKINDNLNLISAVNEIKNNKILFSETEKISTYKSSNNIRNNYITRLICNNIWLPNNKEKNHNSIIIFDWDDTLLCTTFLTPNGIFYDNIKIEKKDLEKITKLESLTYNILKSSIEKGETYIITNAARGWVEYSAKRFYPKVYPLLSKLNIISARGEFEKKHPGDSRQWKILTFLKLVKIIDTKLVTNIICLGDSLIEMEAAHILASKFSQVFIKTVKFRENPTPEELFKQLQLILNQFDHIFSAVKNLTIKVERKSKNPSNNKTNYTSFQNLSNFDISQIRNSMPNQANIIKSAEKLEK